MAKLHLFSVEVATEYGINAAVILQNIIFWTEKKIANKQAEDDGLYYIYNSVRAWNELFPYLTKNTIASALAKLEKAGLLVNRTDLNQRGFDRTKHYALTSKALSLFISENQQCISKNQQRVSIAQKDELRPKEAPEALSQAISENQQCISENKKPISENQQCISEIQQTIPDSKLQIINTDNKLIKKTNKKSSVKKLSASEKLIEDHPIFGLVESQVLTDWLEHRKLAKASNSKTALSRIENTLNTLFQIHNINPTESLAIQIERGWKGLQVDWVINHFQPQQPNQTTLPAAPQASSNFIQKHTDTSWAD